MPSIPIKMLNLNILCSVWLKALALYLVFNLRGPKTAPRAHMGRPVWAASNHLTATSPANTKVDSLLTVAGGQKVSQTSKWRCPIKQPFTMTHPACWWACPATYAADHEPLCISAWRRLTPHRPQTSHPPLSRGSRAEITKGSQLLKEKVKW